MIRGRAGPRQARLRGLNLRGIPACTCPTRLGARSLGFLRSVSTVLKSRGAGGGEPRTALLPQGFASIPSGCTPASAMQHPTTTTTVLGTLAPSVPVKRRDAALVDAKARIGLAGHKWWRDESVMSTAVQPSRLFEGAGAASWTSLRVSAGRAGALGKLWASTLAMRARSGRVPMSRPLRPLRPTLGGRVREAGSVRRSSA